MSVGGTPDTTSMSAAGCRVVPFQGRYTLATDDPQGNGMLLATLEGYRTAIFLQPAERPARKGIIDSVTCGCIPVPSTTAAQRSSALGWLWLTTVLLPGEAALNGSLNVLDALELSQGAARTHAAGASAERPSVTTAWWLSDAAETRWRSHWRSRRVSVLRGKPVRASPTYEDDKGSGAPTRTLLAPGPVSTRAWLSLH